MRLRSWRRNVVEAGSESAAGKCCVELQCVWMRVGCGIEVKSAAAAAVGGRGGSKVIVVGVAEREARTLQCIKCECCFPFDDLLGKLR